VPKDVVFVIDTSGSMLGTKMEQVKVALRHGITGLAAIDRFNIIPFSTEARRFRDGLAEANEAEKRLAGVFIDEMKASGGTNLEEGLRFGLSDLQSPGRLQMVVLLSDGEPTIGVTAPPEILARVKEKNPQRRRVFIFGVGEDLNARLLDLLAKETAGATQYIRSSENIEVPLSSFFDKIDSPVLTDIRVEFPSGGVADLYPRPLPDLFRGEQLEILGRYTADGQKTVLVRGKLQGEDRVFEHSLPFPGGQNGHVARLWAQRKVGYLIEQMRLGGESKEVKDEVIRLSKLYGIVTPYTSYLILEEDRLAFQRDPGRRELRERLALSDALGAPVGAAPGATPAPVAESATRAAKGFRDDKGEGAIELSKEVDNLKRGAGGAGAVNRFVYGVVNRSGERLKQVDERSFYLQEGRWIDSAITAGQAPQGAPERRVKYLSDEYFQLLKDEPGIGKLLAVGEKVTFLWKGRVIVVEG
jgi:Ca-activated chloride channel family protein